jgi:hypothetical protein
VMAMTGSAHALVIKYVATFLSDECPIEYITHGRSANLTITRASSQFVYALVLSSITRAITLPSRIR